LTELCFLCPDSLDLESKRLSVTGKGNKPRGIPIPPALIPILTHYLSEVRPTLPSSPLVFVNPRSNASRRFHGRIAPYAVEDLCDRQVKVQVPPSHTSRIVGDSRTPRALLRRGVDIYKVKRTLGHAKLVTTERYPTSATTTSPTR
jgi:site-specific recombinase XerD